GREPLSHFNECPPDQHTGLANAQPFAKVGDKLVIKIHRGSHARLLASVGAEYNAPTFVR
ncbi:MAG: hypothetical protein ABIR77_06605, partial [Sphingomicrobium sp.]